ncbi:MAG: hypothetical protein O7J95_19800, partial [Planctomycetota bacterium]|nr:hypothetical protein [Planctomycetota bacterium]
AGDLGQRVAEGADRCRCAPCRRRTHRYEDLLEPGAIDCYERSAALDPDFLEVRKKLAALYREAGRPKDAEEVTVRILERFPREVSTLLELGEACRQRKAYLKAFRYFEKARELEPLNSKVLERLADCLVASAWRRAEKKRHELARKDLRKADEFLRGALPARHLVFWTALERVSGDLAASEALLERALEAGLWEAEVCARMAGALRRLGAAREDSLRFEKRLDELLEQIPRDAESVGRALSVYSLTSDASEFGPSLETALPKLRRFFRQAAKVPLSRQRRLELCHAFAAQEDHPLVVAHAAEGGKSFPDVLEFVILEAESRRATGAPLPRKLSRALRRGLEEAETTGDREIVRRLVQVIAPSRSGRGPGLLGSMAALGDFEDDGEDVGEDVGDEEGPEGGRTRERFRRRRSARKAKSEPPVAQRLFDFLGSGRQGGGVDDDDT